MLASSKLFEGGEDDLSGDCSFGLSPDHSNDYAIALFKGNDNKIACSEFSSLSDLSTNVHTTVYNRRHSRCTRGPLTTRSNPRDFQAGDREELEN
jgi:hypothetical protein